MTDKKSTYQQMKDLISTANSTAAQVKGAANDISSSVAQGLQAVGMDKQAKQVSKPNDRFQSSDISQSSIYDFAKFSCQLSLFSFHPVFP